MTQDKLSSLAGVTKRTQVNYEGNKRSPDAEYLAAIARFGIDIGYVVTGIRADTLDLKYPAGRGLRNRQVVDNVKNGIRVNPAPAGLTRSGGVEDATDVGLLDLDLLRNIYLDIETFCARWLPERTPAARWSLIAQLYDEARRSGMRPDVGAILRLVSSR